MKRKRKRREVEENTPIATENLLRPVSSEHLEHGIDVDNGLVGLERVSDDEAARRRLEEIPDGEGQRTPIVESESLVLVAAQIRIATIPLHLFNP